jgi:regulator of replication initiation timing
MKLSPQQIGVCLGQQTKQIEQLNEECAQLRAENEALNSDMDRLKGIVENMLMKHNPDFKKKRALQETDEFLRNRFGKPRPAIANQG